MNLKKIKIFHILIALAVASVGWISHFYRFPQHETPLVILGSGIILGLLFRMGVNYAQGYHTGKPVTLEKLLQREDNEK